MEIVNIYTEYIRLQDFLKLAGAVDTGGEAKVEIQGGGAAVNGETCTQRGRKLRPGDTVSFRGRAYQVGREDENAESGQRARTHIGNGQSAQTHTGGGQSAQTRTGGGQSAQTRTGGGQKERRHAD